MQACSTGCLFSCTLCNAAGVVDPILSFHRATGAVLNPVTRIQLFKLAGSSIVDGILVQYMLNDESDQIGNLDAIANEP